MQRRLFFVFALFFSLILFGCGSLNNKTNLKTNPVYRNTSPEDRAYKKKPSIDRSLEKQTEAQPSKSSANINVKSCDMPSQANTTPSTGDIQPILDEALDFCDVAQELWQKGELEAAIEALDQAYSLILSLDDTALDHRLVQQKEDIRFMISKRILEIYASRNIVVNGNHNEIPLDLNKHVQAEIDLFTKGKERKFFINAYVRSGRYRDYIVKELKAAGLPEELSWLPLIESGYQENALSSARALGLWQFIPSTGYKFGLKRNTFIDERLDPVKSTAAAIAYLKEMHQIFGDWSTVLAGYNCGEGRVLRIIRNQNINYLDNFWDLYERLPRETARYVPRFLATLHIVKNPQEFGITLPEVEKAFQYETITISRQVHLKNIAAKIGVTEKELKRLNPELRYSILPNENYKLRVPEGKREILLASVNSIPVSHLPRPAYSYHRVRSGETLSTIANRYRTSVKRIMAANRLKNSNYIVAGKTLKIPGRGYTTSYDSSQKSTHTKPTKYVVKSGDSLWIIAKRFHTTTKNIQSVNKLSSTRLRIGQVLEIPSGYGTATSASRGTYVVKCGDSPYQIAQKHKMSLSRFLSLNRLTPRSKIYPGQKLVVE